mmetsp:Transcript_14334/g.47560  ORF Transcript_14334/g.47560 Transcript_14334/m.47560 type:complete len:224 (+) Transcript_14334:861-1532(+)
MRLRHRVRVLPVPRPKASPAFADRGFAAFPETRPRGVRVGSHADVRGEQQPKRRHRGGPHRAAFAFAGRVGRTRASDTAGRDAACETSRDARGGAKKRRPESQRRAALAETSRRGGPGVPETIRAANQAVLGSAALHLRQKQRRERRRRGRRSVHGARGEQTPEGALRRLRKRRRRETDVRLKHQLVRGVRPKRASGTRKGVRDDQVVERQGGGGRALDGGRR